MLFFIERYGKVGQRVFRLIFQSSFGMPYETAQRILDIIQDDSGEYYCKYSRRNVLNKRVTVKNKVDASDVKTLQQSIKSLSVPVLPAHELGCDGGDVTLEIHSPGCQSIFSWWAYAPQGWEDLDRICTEIIRLSGIDNP